MLVSSCDLDRGLGRAAFWIGASIPLVSLHRYSYHQYHSAYDLLPRWCPGTMRGAARLLLTGRLEPAEPGSQTLAGPQSMICGDVPGGMQLGSNRGHSTHITMGIRARSSMNSGFLAAGGTGTTPAPCGCGALGAPSKAVQRRPSTSSRCVVSVVVSAPFTQAQGEGRSSSWNDLISSGRP